jgi:hypothetical protein
MADDERQGDLTGEQEREHEAATSGIVARPAVLDLDTSGDDLDAGEETGDADDDDDETVEDPDAAHGDPDM